MGREIMESRRKRRRLWEPPKWARTLVELEEDCTMACNKSHTSVPPCTTTSFFCATDAPVPRAETEIITHPAYWSCSHVCFCRFDMFMHSFHLCHHYLLELLWDDDCILVTKEDLGHNGVLNLTDVQNKPHPSTTAARDMLIVVLYRRHDYCDRRYDDVPSDESPDTYKLCEFHDCNIVFRKRGLMAVRFCSLSCKIKHYDTLNWNRKFRS